MKQFKIGDKVTWTSQAAGWGKKRKTGEVVQVVKPHETVARVHPNHTVMFDGGRRDHESYLVSVPPKTGKAKPKLYWPRVSALQKAEADQ